MAPAALGSDLGKPDTTTAVDIARPIADPDVATELSDEQLADADVWDGDRYVGQAKDVRAGRLDRPANELVTLRLDREILDHFRVGGPGWQTRLVAALRQLVRTIDWSDPGAHAALIEQVGPQRYSEQFELDQRNRVIARVGGHPIRAVRSRFGGRLYMIDTADAIGFDSLAEAARWCRANPVRE